MPTFNLETSDSEKPILLVAGKNPLAEAIIDEARNDFKIAFISDDNEIASKFTQENTSGFYRIETSSSHLIKNLEEKIDYAVIFLSDSQDRKYLEHVLEKLSDDHSKVCILIDVAKHDDFSDVILSYKNNPSFYFLFIGDIYSEKKRFNYGFRIADFIKEALISHTVHLTGDDLTPIFPIYHKDALLGINHILLGPNRKHKFYYLFYSHPQTVISATHILKRVEPDLEMQFKEEPSGVSRRTHDEIEKAITSKALTTPVYLDKYLTGFEKSISNFSKIEEEEEIKEEPKIVMPEIVREQKKHVKPAVFYIFAAVFLYIAISVILTGFSAFLFKQSADAFRQGDYQKAISTINTSKTLLNIVSPNILLTGAVARTFGITQYDSFFDNFQDSSELLAMATGDINRVSGITTEIDPNTFDRLVADAVYLYFAAEKFKSIFPTDLLSNFITPETSPVLSLSQVASHVLGFDSEKNYLVLFQNNGELRPTGGFIGSVGELKVSKGKIEELEIYDVYDFDGQIKAHVEPHYVVRRNLQPHLYIRDSNFDLSFQESASKAALLYNLASSKKIDGVIAVNYNALEAIIKEVGPIKLNEYNQTIDEKNAFDFLQKTIDDNFFPGSTQKKDVLNALYTQILLKLETDKNSFIRVAKLIPSLMSQKDIIFAFNRNSIQAIFSSNGFGGDYPDPRKENDETILDFLSVNEANIGVNKANTSITYDTKYEVNLGDEITSKISHTIINRGDNPSDYKAYLRIITPQGSTLIGITIDGEEQEIAPAVVEPRIYEARNFRDPEGLEVDETNEVGRRVFGFIVNVPKNTEQTIEVSYENGAGNVSSQVINYSLLVAKQPGVKSLPFEAVVKYPEDMSPAEVENATLNKGSITIRDEITKDKEFDIKFLKK